MRSDARAVRVVIPLGVQRPYDGVGEQQAHVVAAARGDAGEVGVQGCGGGVPVEDVEAAAEHEGGRVGELVDQAAHRGPDLLSRAVPGRGALPASS